VMIIFLQIELHELIFLSLLLLNPNYREKTMICDVI
jgi:hypothetical protein